MLPENEFPLVVAVRLSARSTRALLLAAVLFANVLWLTMSVQVILWAQMSVVEAYRCCSVACVYRPSGNKTDSYLHQGADCMTWKIELLCMKAHSSVHGNKSELE